MKLFVISVFLPLVDTHVAVIDLLPVVDNVMYLTFFVLVLFAESLEALPWSSKLSTVVKELIPASDVHVIPTSFGL